MPKLFVVSDIHGFYDELRIALDNAGFDAENEEHWLITCGDHFDRGSAPAEVMKYLMNLPRKVLVKGNHEQLLLDCCNRGAWYSHDISNGTYKTICDLGGADEGFPFEVCCIRTLGKTSTFIDEMVNYFETENYIFVHGWLPVDGWCQAPYRKNKHFVVMDNFREATQKQWDEAMWLCGPDMALDGYNNTGKTVVFGHWHTSYLWSFKDGVSEFGDDAKFDIFYGNDFIALDACTAHTGKVNVLVIEDNFLQTTQN